MSNPYMSYAITNLNHNIENMIKEQKKQNEILENILHYIKLNYDRQIENDKNDKNDENDRQIENDKNDKNNENKEYGDENV